MTVPTDRGSIDALVDRFYRTVRADHDLGQLFARYVSDWNAHLPIMKRFWRSVLLGMRAYRGTPFALHRDMDGIEHDHFRRWLELFADAANETLSPAVARKAIGSATNIATGFWMGRNADPTLVPLDWESATQDDREGNDGRRGSSS